MATTETAASPPYSPGVGARRKAIKVPKLPLSAFTPPTTGTSEQFPLPPSPSTVHPALLVDAGVVEPVEKWKEQIGAALVAKSRGVVRMLETLDEAAIKEAESDPSVLAVSIPFDLSNGAPPTDSLPSVLATPPKNVAIALRTSFTAFSPQLADGLYWAISRGHAVDLHVLVDLQSEGGWESLSELITGAMSAERPAPTGKTGAIILSNVLPAPLDLSVPLVKLLTHPVYTNFQNYISTISLNSNVHLKYSPPAWGAVPNKDDEIKSEWNRRIKMYLGQGVEAFGYQRILYASGPSEAGTAHAGDWYALARQSLAELGMEQEAVDGIFGSNAQSVYAV